MKNRQRIQLTEKEIQMAFKYMKRWSPSLLRKLQWKLLYTGTTSHLSDGQKYTTLVTICSSYRETGILIHSWLKYKLLPIFMKDNREGNCSKLQTHSPSDPTINTIYENFLCILAHYKIMYVQSCSLQTYIIYKKKIKKTHSTAGWLYKPGTAR